MQIIITKHRIDSLELDFGNTSLVHSLSIMTHL